MMEKMRRTMMRAKASACLIWRFSWLNITVRISLPFEVSNPVLRTRAMQLALGGFCLMHSGTNELGKVWRTSVPQNSTLLL